MYSTYIVDLLQTMHKSDSDKSEIVWQSLVQVRYFDLENFSMHGSVNEHSHILTK
jgi:hypothetical protein